MEEDVEEFLRSRHIPEETIHLMKADKINKSVLRIMTEEQLSKYIERYGDRLAILSFVVIDKEAALESLRSNINRRRAGTIGTRRLHSTPSRREGNPMARHSNRSAQRQQRRIEIGWLHYSNNEYRQVRTGGGGGTRDVRVDKHTTVAQILEIGKGLFFRNGLSSKGPVEQFSFHVSDFARNLVPLDDTVCQMYDRTKLKMLRFYICTKDRQTGTGFGNDEGNDIQPAECRSDTDFERPSDDPLESPRTLEMPIDNDADTLLWDPQNDGQGVTVSEDDVIVVNLASINTDNIVEVDIPNLPLPDGLPSDIHDPPPPSSTIAGDSDEPKQVHYAFIHRVTVMTDLLAAFMDPNIMRCNLKIEFINEKAIDDSGVSREAYTAFWEQFLQLCDGEEERVPRSRADFTEAKWQAAGRIWSKGFEDHAILPVRLSKSFILACIHGIDAVDDEVLMSSFLQYLSSAERCIVEKALNGTLEESDEEDLLDFFTRMGSHYLPHQNDIQPAIRAMAHWAIVQEPKYVVDCFSKALACTQFKLPDKDRLLSLYEKQKPNGKKVAQLLQTTQDIVSQQEQTTFNYLQRYVKNADQRQVEKFLRFCTGASVICVDKIAVSFNGESGFKRRPVAHTCGATLEVPYTYRSYPDFRTEFDNILHSDYLHMDIL